MQHFSKIEVQGSRPDGYWVEAFPFHTKDTQAPDLVGYGLGTSQDASKIHVFRNPYRKGQSSIPPPTGDWQNIHVATLQFPVAFCCADISGNGYNDIILSDTYGSSMNDIWSDGGRVSWFENTGDYNREVWTQRYIGRSPGMHRLKTGHFTTSNAVQIIAVPIVIKSGDFESPAPVIIYTAPPDPRSPQVDGGWPNEIAFKDTFRLVHEITVIPGANNGLDQVLLAGREGISLIWYNETSKKWMSEHLGSGLSQTRGNPFWGSGSVDVAKVHDDSAGYIASCEAFHGNTVSVYTKPTNAPKSQLRGVNWTRHVLEDFGPLNKEHTGSIHYVVCADIDNDGVEELLVALMGSDPPSWEKTGVWCYKPVDLQKAKFSKRKLSDNSAGRIAIADFKSTGVLDYATISYSVPGYFVSPNPSINAFINAPITAERLNDEVLFRVPRPTAAPGIDEVMFLDVASRKLALVVVPPHQKYAIAQGDGIKVIAGRVTWTNANDTTHERTIATAPFTAVSTKIDAKDGHVYTQAEGAVFVLMKHSTTSGAPPYSNMKQLAAHNLFNSRFPKDLQHMSFPWVKVEDRPWANGGFKGLEFYNLTGFYVRYADDSDDLICHIQLWTAGVGVSAGFHNHTDKSFCEIHACIVNGTGKGGMYWATVEDELFDPAKPDEDKYTGIAVPDMSEHGPLWRTSEDGLPLLRSNDTVNYPWHAWIAGKSPTAGQKFDVWLAFEFPPFVAEAEQTANMVTLKPGKYRIFNPASQLELQVQGGESKDGAPVVGHKKGPGSQAWEISVIPGTRFQLFHNDVSRSNATVVWPPTAGQKVVGSRSAARLDLTSAWALASAGGNTYEVRLIGTHLVLEVDAHGKVHISPKDLVPRESQKWHFEAVSST
ncbi:hypothetical protein PUNSTDRAFT_128760 [Punctularia strigosozonata HHB-11173 SS5]|uniref:Uncharacterized protein n=1 Tax=Punctularia strigosozonata (strain HHB-11173) TaxID=741275 RepID=R7S2J1_PUNST|nr:uncharacterized protein PUNSTDRAFT_128760 [Punctularia strigosozonata HHB-11173 SS5]EIN03466.1 hypothetical protein PUNSTDRAFT_128760 [Punctularia strigosozonata HHB-11173 SS5]